MSYNGRLGSSYGKQRRKSGLCRPGRFDNSNKYGHDVVGGRRREGLNGSPSGVQSKKILCERFTTKRALANVLNEAPIVNDLYTTYLLADSLFENWDLINQAFQAYQNKDSSQLSNLLQVDEAQEELRDAQTNIVWLIANKAVPAGFKTLAKALLTKVVGHLTSAEINFAVKFLRKQRNKTHIVNKRDHATYNYLSSHRKIPDEVNRV